MSKDAQRPDGKTGGEGFHEPRLAINRVYTKKGDSGTTALVGGQRVDKDDARIDAYGTIDELNALIGLARVSVDEAADEATSSAPTPAAMSALAAQLLRVQHELFNLGSILATLPEDVHPRQPRITAIEVEALERDIDACQPDLGELRSFVLPGGHRLNAELHICRTVCRRAERLLVALARTSTVDPEAVAYLNRLSDALFVWSRWASAKLETPETLWQPNRAASGLDPSP